MRKSSSSRLSTGRKSRNKSARSAFGNASPVQTEIDETNVDDESGWFILLFHYDHEQRVRE